MLTTTAATFILVTFFSSAVILVVCLGRRVAAAEYRRALRDYRNLVDHRLANPLTVIGGAAQTLLDTDVSLPPAQRRDLLRAIVEQAERIERVSLSPRVQLGCEEQALRAVPMSRVQHRAIA